MEVQFRSPVFSEGMRIPKKYTCEGEDVSPPFAWKSVAEGAKSLAIACDDADAPNGAWVHWVLYGLPPDVRELPEGVPADETLENGARQGKNDFGRIGYGGPCPPEGDKFHRYFYKVFVLDTEIDLPAGASKAELSDAMAGHVLSQAQLMGTYQRISS